MRSQLNSPLEMVRRCAYLIYVAVFLTYLFSCVVALSRHGRGDIVTACAAFLLLVSVRYAGYRWLEFERLGKSFPAGCARDCVPPKIRTEVESLIYEFHAPGTEWPRRAAIRRYLMELEGRTPEIIEAYEEELKNVLAA